MFVEKPLDESYFLSKDTKSQDCYRQSMINYEKLVALKSSWYQQIRIDSWN